MSISNYNRSLTDIIENGDIEELKLALQELSAFELAELILSKSDNHQSAIFGALSEQVAVETFEFLPVYSQRRLLHLMPSLQVAHLLKSLSPDDRTLFLQDLPRETIDELVKLLPYEERILTLTLLGYPKGSIGRLMTTDYLVIKKDWTIEQVLDHIQAYGHDSETINDLYVIDDNNHLLDDIRLKNFLFVPRHTKVSEICNNTYVALSVYDSDETAVRRFKESDRSALPVIDEHNTLLGIVTIDDILKLSDKEATKEIQNFGGMQALDEPYLKAPFLDLMSKRAGWLVVLFIGEMFTATAMGYFEDQIQKAVVLALFLPLIISSGGNAGSQASTLVIRAMALGEVKLNDWWKIVRLEVLSGLFLGAILGLIGFFRISLWTLFSSLYGEHWLLLAIAVGLSLVGVVLWGTLSGAIFPLLLKKLGFDPAKASAPLVATFVDVFGVVIYFLIAIYILSGTLL